MHVSSGTQETRTCSVFRSTVDVGRPSTERKLWTGEVRMKTRPSIFWDETGEEESPALTQTRLLLFLCRDVGVLSWRRPVYPLLLHHRFSCFSFSSRPPGNILLTHPQPSKIQPEKKEKKKKDPIPLMLCRSRAFPHFTVSCHPPETGLRTFDYALRFLPPCFPPIINPSLRPAYSCLFCAPRGSLLLFRQDLSSSVKLQSAHRSAGCLEKMTMTYQTPQTFH